MFNIKYKIVFIFNFYCLLFVWLIVLISGTTGSNLKSVFVFGSPLIEESFKL